MVSSPRWACSIYCRMSRMDIPAFATAYRMADELEKAAEALYGKYVPAGVREFIELNAESKAAAKPKKPRPAPSSAVGVPSATGGDPA